MRMPDIYFTPEYGKAYEDHERGNLEVFDYNDSYGQISCQFIRRRLTQFDGYAEYSDIITPYGYGGPIVLECPDECNKNLLINNFKKSFTEYCSDNKIVSFFIRFHPLVKNANDFKTVFDEVTAVRKIVAIDLSKDLLNEEIEKKAKKNYNRALKKNMVYEHDPECKMLDLFHEMYTKTMDKNNATQYYYFSRDYFTNLKKLLGDSMEMYIGKLEDRVIFLLLTFCFGDYVHMHLSTSSKEGYDNNASEFVKINCALQSAQRGFKWMVLGGGVTNDPNDPLYLFKKKLSRTEPFDFYIGKNIFDRKVYDELCKIAEKQKGSELNKDFFPMYRA